MGSVLISTVNKLTEGPCRFFKNVRWGILLFLDVVFKKGINFSDFRIRKLYLCYMYFFMYLFILFMIDVGVLIRIRFYFILVKYGIKLKVFV